MTTAGADNLIHVQSLTPLASSEFTVSESFVYEMAKFLEFRDIETCQRVRDQAARRCQACQRELPHPRDRGQCRVHLRIRDAHRRWHQAGIG